MRQHKPINPFNVVLLVVGVLFVVTACGYSVMAVKGAHPLEAGQETESGQRLLGLLDEHGFTALMVELAVLAVATFAAIATDDYWARRGAAQRESTADKLPGDEDQ